MTMLQHGLVPSTGGYQIERSLRFNSADSASLTRTPASSSNRQKFTWSAWVKRSQLGVAQFLFGQAASTASACDIRFAVDDAFGFVDESVSLVVTTTQVFRDVSAWYHVMVAVDTTQATASNRVKLYVNGSQITALASTSYPSQNANTQFNTTNQAVLGNRSGGGTNYFNGYMTEVYFIDGSQLDASSFGENDTDTGVWKPKAYTGSYGTNGFKLTFSDNSGTTSTTLGKDTSGNGNNWTPNNFSVTAGAGNDSLVDTPTPYGTDTGAGGEVRGNYCTLNPIGSGPNATFSNGNLDVGGSRISVGTMAVSSGKWYWEVTDTNGNSNIGFQSITDSVTATYIGQSTTSYSYLYNGNKINNNVFSSYGASYTTNDVIGIALDLDAGTVVFYKNGVSQGTAFTGISGTMLPAYGTNGTATASFNFGQRPFAYTAPSGFKALCTTNLPTPTIGATSTTRADDYFNTVLYTGNGTTQSITGVGFSPDLVWVKSRNNTYAHQLFDSVRGVNLALFSNETTAETNLGTLTAFGTDGFTVSTNSGAYAGTNGNTATFAAWNWRGSDSSAVSNTQGTITSTVSANTTAGFSIVTYTGTGANATVGHGLGVAPSMIIVKSRSAVTEWAVGHSGLTSWGYFLKLNSTVAQASASVVWNNTAPTSTVFSVGSEPDVNSNGGNYVAYCFAQVSSYSSFGSYTGNGSSDGPFIYTGFRPAFVLMKARGLSESWQIVDSDRNDYNVVDKVLSPNNSNAEAAGTTVHRDFLSNGFKIRTSDSSQNTNGQVYIYAAFAENPFKYSLAR